MGNFISSNKENFYYLALFKHKHQYTIHGLWPQYSDNTWPSFCKDIPFNIDKLKPLEKKLLEYWELPKDHDKLEISFWSHEWKKHGTCMFTSPPMTEFEYFSKAIELYEYVIENLNIEGYNQNGRYMIPFDLEFNLKQ